MYRLILGSLMAAALCAQNTADLFNKPPAGVDEALRARINEFYGYHVKQQYRKAEEMVAQDTRDYFYSKTKPKYLSFEISRVEYSKDYTHAKATMITEQYVMMPGFTDKPLKVPSPSRWKLEDGKWCWYVDVEELRNSPFGKMTGGPGAPGQLPANAVPASPEFIMGKVKPDRTALKLKPGQSAEVKISNAAPGYMYLRVLDMLGFDVKLDSSQLAPNSAATLTIKAGTDARSGTLTLRVEPTRETLAIDITVER